jgi:hypothetical protein
MVYTSTFNVFCEVRGLLTRSQNPVFEVIWKNLSTVFTLIHLSLTILLSLILHPYSCLPGDILDSMLLDQNFLSNSHFPNTLYDYRSCHAYLIRPNNICRRDHTMKLLILQLPPDFCLFPLLRSIIFFTAFCSKNSKRMYFLLKKREYTLRPHQTRKTTIWEFMKNAVFWDGAPYDSCKNHASPPSSGNRNR